MQRSAEAEELLKESLSIYQRLVEKVPTEHTEGLAQVCYITGLLYQDHHRQDAAKAMLQKAHALFGDLAERMPEAYRETVEELAKNLTNDSM